MTSWNIIIKYLDKPIEVIYPLTNGCIKIKTNIIPIIFDYGKSHIIHHGVHLSGVNNKNAFRMSTIQDIIHIIFTSSSTIIKFQDESKYDKYIIKIMNFFYNSGSSKFIKKKFNNINTIKNFLYFNRVL